MDADPTPRGSGTGREQGPTFDLVEPAPDSVLLVDVDGVVQTRGLHRALGADVLGAPFAFELLFFALEVRRRKEHTRLRPPACRLVLPGLFIQMCAQRTPPPLSMRNAR